MARSGLPSLPFLLLLALLAACSRGGEPAELDPTDLEVRMYQAGDLSCEGCPERLEARVTQVPGVIDADAVPADGTVVVRVNPYENVMDETILNAIRAAGFEPGKRIR